MTAVVCLVAVDIAQLGDGGKHDLVGIGYAEHLLTLGIVEKLSARVEQLQSVPLHGVVACREDDTSGRALAGHSDLRGGGRGEADVHHIKTHGCECAAHEALHHLARETRVAPHDDELAPSGREIA